MAAPAKRAGNLAARMGRWSAQHRKKAIWGWLVCVVLAFAIGGAVGTNTQDAAQSGVGQSGSAERTIDNAFPKHQVEQVLIQSGSATATDPSFRAVVGDLQHRLSAVPYAQAFESPYAPGNAGQISYAAAKAGLIGMTRTLAKELATRAITVNCVTPGFIETDMTAAHVQGDNREALIKQIPLGRIGSAEDVAEAVRFLVSPRASYITGQVVRVNGGLLM